MLKDPSDQAWQRKVWFDGMPEGMSVELMTSQNPLQNNLELQHTQARQW